MNDKEYIAELEKVVIFLCDVYSKGAESLSCQTSSNGQVDEKWLNIFMSFPTIQGGINRIFVERIGKLRTNLHNREAIKMSFEDLYNRIKIGRTEK
jgi:hypothetical protein